LRQLLACQSLAPWETAPAVEAAVLCVVSAVGLPHALVPNDQREVGPRSRGVLLPGLNPYLSHDGTAFAGSLLLYPQPSRLTSRFAFLGGARRAYHVPPTRRDG